MELEKMSDIELLHAYAGCNDMKLYQASEKELLKRLSKNNIEELPLVLPDITIGLLKVKNWEFTVRTFNIEGKKPYLVYRYENPKNKNKYVFHSKSINGLKEYLEEFNLINNIDSKKLNWDGWIDDPKKIAQQKVEEFIFRIKNYMKKHDKIGLTYTEISNFDHFEKMSKEELEDIENGKFNK